MRVLNEVRDNAPGGWRTMMHPMRKAFYEHLKDDPKDVTTRRVFADWLEEEGHDEEARLQREWSLERYEEAEAFMKDYAEMLSGEDDSGGGYRRITVGRVLEAAADRLAGGFDGIGLRFDTPDEVYSRAEEFWKHYAVLTGTYVEEGRSDTFVSCGC